MKKEIMLAGIFIGLASCAPAISQVSGNGVSAMKLVVQETKSGMRELGRFYKDVRDAAKELMVVNMEFVCAQDKALRELIKQDVFEASKGTIELHVDKCEG